MLAVDIKHQTERQIDQLSKLIDINLGSKDVVLNLAENDNITALVNLREQLLHTLDFVSNKDL